MGQRKQDTIRQLQADPRIYGHCCHCQESFPLRRALLFYADEPMPTHVQEKVEAWRSDLRTRRLGLRERRRRAHEVAEKQAIDVNLGKILEKIAPVMGGFGYSPRDCRGLFEPIDYIVFNELSAHKEVNALIFLDVKTGGAGLNPHQRQIRSAVEAGKVEWEGYSLGEKP